jgi:hypothetical protein
LGSFGEREKRPLTPTFKLNTFEYKFASKEKQVYEPYRSLSQKTAEKQKKSDRELKNMKDFIKDVRAKYINRSRVGPVAVQPQQEVVESRVIAAATPEAATVKKESKLGIYLKPSPKTKRKASPTPILSARSYRRHCCEACICYVSPISRRG